MSDFETELAEQRATEAAERRRTGGPAFPQNDLSGYGIGPEYPTTGMMLRDFYAAHALTGLLSANATYGGRSDNREALSRDAFAHADAMLAARHDETERT